MTGFLITALTKVGTDALDQCIQEEKVEFSRRPFLDRMKFHKIWIQKIDRSPLRYSMTIHPDALRFILMDRSFSIKKIISEVKIAMTKNGASIGQDYFVEELGS
jgi:hypothetical protein